jgi:hypothetical protein
MQDAAGPKKVKLSKLTLNRETVQELSESEAGNVQGGRRRAEDGTVVKSSCAAGCVSWTVNYCPLP